MESMSDFALADDFPYKHAFGYFSFYHTYDGPHFLHALVERLKEVQTSAGVEKNIQNEKDASKKAGHSRKKTASSEEEIEL